jgi:opacity protein-like surface antigen
VRRAVALLAAALLATGAGTASAASARHDVPYTVKRAAYRATVRFEVTYTGSGIWRTDFHATPPNDGGDPDTNDAHDFSTQTWDIGFLDRLRVPACGVPDLDNPDACDGVEGLSGARGATRATGSIDHTHVDGLYRELDRTVRCRLSKHTKPTRRVDAAVDVTYSPDAKTFMVTARDPVATVMLSLPTACPDQGDSIDRILDNYFAPGFSFADGWGEVPWFTTRTVAIPARDMHHARQIKVPLGDVAPGTPPRDCAVEHPEYERCDTRGRYGGVLTLTAP